MNNLSLYLRTLRILKKISLDTVSRNVYMSKSKLYRIELGEISLNQEDQLVLYNYYGVQNPRLDTEIKQNILELLNQLIINDKHNFEIEYEISDYNQIMLPYYMLWNYIVNYWNPQTRNNALVELGKNLTSIVELMPDIYQAIFYCLYGFSFTWSNQYQKAKYYLDKIQTLKYNHELLFALTNQHYILINYNLEYYYDYFKLYKETRDIFEKNGAKGRLIKLNTLYANALSKLGFYEECIKLEKEIIAQKNFIKENTYYISVHNVGVEYSSIKKYEEALPYHLEVLEYLDNEETRFEVAWCYYNLDNFIEAKKHLTINKRNYKTNEYTLLCKWLEEMIKKRYSKNCLEILKRIEKVLEKKPQKESNEFLYIQLMECLEEQNKEKEALKYAKKLVTQYVKVR